MNPIGQRVGWLLTGVGRAYLAFCPQAEREEILRRLRKSDQPEDALARDPKRLDKRPRRDPRARLRHCAIPVSSAEPYGMPPQDDGLAAIVVPLAGPRPRARLDQHSVAPDCIYDRGVCRPASTCRNLRAAASEIVEDRCKLTQSASAWLLPCRVG